MKNTFKFFGIIAIVAIIGFSMAACGDLIDSLTTSVEGIALNKSSITLTVNSSETLVVTFNPSNASNKSVLWSTSNGDVATVNLGVVTGKAPGTATITATADGGHTATCLVTVTASSSGGVPAAPTGLDATALSSTEILLTWLPVIGATGYNVYNGTSPSALQGPGFVTTSYVTNNNLPPNTTVYYQVAAVNASGEGPRSTIVSATTLSSGSGSVPVTGVTLNQTSLNLTALSSATLTATVLPSNATNKSVTWSSSNNNIATVTVVGGVVLAVSQGTAIITATTADGNYTATCLVTVTGGSGGGGTAFTSITDMRTWLTAQPDNTRETPYTIKLNVAALGGTATASASAGKVLKDNPTKYVILDLSGSSFNTIAASSFGSSTASDACATLVGVVIPSTVSSIGSNAFRNTGLTSIIIPNSVTSIETYAFQDCKSLASAIIGNGVITINSYAFYGCTALTSVSIGSAVTAINSYAFRGCSALPSVIIPNNVTSIGSNAFQSCISLTSVTIGNKVTTIGSYAFNACSSLTSIIFTPTSSVLSIQSDAFSSCTSLASVTIPASVTTVANYAFNSCSALVTVKFERTGTSIGGTSSFPNGANLQTAYTAGGAGTYTRSGTAWSRTGN